MNPATLPLPCSATSSSTLAVMSSGVLITRDRLCGPLCSFSVWFCSRLRVSSTVPYYERPSGDGLASLLHRSPDRNSAVCLRREFVMFVSSLMIIPRYGWRLSQGGVEHPVYVVSQHGRVNMGQTAPSCEQSSRIKSAPRQRPQFSSRPTRRGYGQALTRPHPIDNAVTITAYLAQSHHIHISNVITNETEPNRGEHDNNHSKRQRRAPQVRRAPVSVLQVWALRS